MKRAIWFWSWCCWLVVIVLPCQFTGTRLGRDDYTYPVLPPTHWMSLPLSPTPQTDEEMAGCGGMK